MLKKILFFVLIFLISACTVGPNYSPPIVKVPVKYKEAKKPGKNWKKPEPCDECERGQWWKIFRDPTLNALECKLNISNQNIAAAIAQFKQARALIDEARAAYFPTVTGALAITRQGLFGSNPPGSGGGSGSSSSSSSGSSGGGGSQSGAFTSESLLLNAAWELDIWGSVRRSVEASVEGAQASKANVAAVRLSAQGSLAQIYFELRGIDRDQQLLDNTVRDYKASLQLTKNRYHQGVAQLLDVVQAQSQLESAEALAINNHIARTQYEHAIAVLIGEPPAVFSLPYMPLNVKPPIIPLELPSALLERRPDVAQAERLMAQANAQIGVAIAAFFPTVAINASLGSSATGSIGKWITSPLPLAWTIGPQITELLFDGGLRCATTKAARANYESTVAIYRNTVLTAFQDVENNLASLRILAAQSIVEAQAVASAKQALKITINKYKAGTAAYSDVIVAQTNAYTAEKNAADVMYLRMTSAVGLIKALGGCWDSATLNWV